VERAEDVLMHKRLLQLAEDPANRPAFEVHLVQVQVNNSSKCYLFFFFLAKKFCTKYYLPFACYPLIHSTARQCYLS
jgi:hypothetical protein